MLEAAPSSFCSLRLLPRCGCTCTGTPLPRVVWAPAELVAARVHRSFDAVLYVEPLHGHCTVGPDYASARLSPQFDWPGPPGPAAAGGSARTGPPTSAAVASWPCSPPPRPWAPPPRPWAPPPTRERLPGGDIVATLMRATVPEAVAAHRDTECRRNAAIALVSLAVGLLDYARCNRRLAPDCHTALIAHCCLHPCCIASGTTPSTTGGTQGQW